MGRIKGNVTLTALCLGCALQVVGCSNKEGTMVSTESVVYEQEVGTIDKKSMYEYLVSNATVSQKEIDLLGAVGTDTSSFPIVVDNVLGVCTFTDNGMDIENLEVSDLAIEEFADCLYGDYDQVSIAEEFVMKKTGEDTYQVACTALNENKDYKYFEGENYYLPKELEMVEVNGEVFGQGVLTEERSKEVFKEYVSCFYFNANQYTKDGKNKQTEAKTTLDNQPNSVTKKVKA